MEGVAEYREESGKGSPVLISRSFLFCKAFLSTVPPIDRNSRDGFLLQQGLKDEENENSETSLGPPKKGVGEGPSVTRQCGPQMSRTST